MKEFMSPELLDDLQSRVREFRTVDSGLYEEFESPDCLTTCKVQFESLGFNHSGGLFRTAKPRLERQSSRGFHRS